MKGFFSKHFNLDEIPTGVRMLTTATSIHWAGWGFAECLLPIFIFSFGKNYADAGLLKSILDLVVVLCFPIMGLLADVMSATTLTIVGLSIYIFVGTSYFLAGATGLVIYIILARALNGVSYSITATARETYFRRHVNSNKLATAFGYFDTVADFWWIMTALVGIFLITYFPIYKLLFLIVPAAIIAIFVVARYKIKKQESQPEKKEHRLTSKEIFKDIGAWDWRLKILMVLNFFVSFSNAVAVFFISIESFAENGSYVEVIVLGVVSTIPFLFGWSLGKIFDRRGSAAFLISLLAFSGFLFSFGIFNFYLWRIIALFAIGVITELLSVGNNELITKYAHPDHIGRLSGLTRSVSGLGTMMGPIITGLLIDRYGMSNAFFTNGTLILILAIFFWYMHKNKSDNKEMVLSSSVPVAE